MPEIGVDIPLTELYDGLRRAVEQPVAQPG
jgi:hypothetical protein